MATVNKKEEAGISKDSLPANITPEQVDTYKKMYGDEQIRMANLPLDDDAIEFLAVLIRVPDRKTLGEFEKWSDKDPNKSKEILINACLLTDKERVKADDNLFFTCINAISDLIPIRKAIIKKV